MEEEGIDCIISYVCVSIKFIFRPSITTRSYERKNVFSTQNSQYLWQKAFTKSIKLITKNVFLVFQSQKLIKLKSMK